MNNKKISTVSTVYIYCIILVVCIVLIRKIIYTVKYFSSMISISNCFSCFFTLKFIYFYFEIYLLNGEVESELDAPAWVIVTCLGVSIRRNTVHLNFPTLMTVTNLFLLSDLILKVWISSAWIIIYSVVILYTCIHLLLVVLYVSEVNIWFIDYGRTLCFMY